MAKGSRVKELRPVYRVVVIMPRDGGHIERMTATILMHDPLQYGVGYDHVMWESAIGFEKYRTLKGANPTHGKEDEHSSVSSFELAFTIPRDGPAEEIHLRELLDVIVGAHPWEEPEVFVSEVLVTRCV